MKCPQCGTENTENTNFCTSCGAKLEAAEAVQEPVTEAAENNVVEEVKETVTEVAGNSVSFLKKNLKKIIVIAVIVVIAIFALAGISSCMNGGKVDFAKLPVLYTTEDGVNFFMNGKKDIMVLADDEEYNGDIKLTEDGKRIFYVFDGDLYYRETSDKNETSANDGAVRVAKSVDSYVITPDGKTVLYVKGSDVCRIKAAAEQESEKLAKDVAADWDYTSDFKTIVYTDTDGDTFIASNSENKNKVSKDGKCESFFFSEDEKKVILVEVNDEGEKTLSTVGLGKNDKPVTMAKDCTDYYFINDNATELYYTVSETSKKTGETSVELFYKKGDKDKVKVAENVEGVIEKYEGNKSTYYLVTSEEKGKEGEEKTVKTLFKLDGSKEPVEICENYGSIEYGMNVVVQYEEKEQKEDQSYEDWIDSCYTYNMFIKDKLYSFELEKTDGDWGVYNGKFYVIEGAYKKDKESDSYIENEKGGTLVEYKIGGKGLERKNGKTICEDVTDFTHFGDMYAEFDGRTIKNINKDMIAIESGDDCYVYVGGKVTELEDLESFENVVAIEGKNVYYYGDFGDDGEYCIFKFNGSKVELLAEDVIKHQYVTSKYIYFINEDEELHVVKGAGKSELVAEDAIGFVGYPVVVTPDNDVKGSGAYYVITNYSNDYYSEW